MDSSGSISNFGYGLHDRDKTRYGSAQSTDSETPRKPKSSIIKLHSSTRFANPNHDGDALDRKVHETFEPMSLKRKIVFGICLLICSFSFVDLMAGLTFHDNPVQMIRVAKIMLLSVCIMVLTTDRRTDKKSR
jgi:hypothetical protein